MPSAVTVGVTQPLPAEVFQGGTDVIDGAVDAEKTLCFTPRFLATTMLKQTWHCSYGLSKKVVDFVELFHLDGLVLGVRSSSSRGIPVGLNRQSFDGHTYHTRRAPREHAALRLIFSPPYNKRLFFAYLEKIKK